MTKLKSISDIRAMPGCPNCKAFQGISNHWTKFLQPGDKAFCCGICGYTWIADKGEAQTSVDAMINSLRQQVDRFELK